VVRVRGEVRYEGTKIPVYPFAGLEAGLRLRCAAGSSLELVRPDGSRVAVNGPGSLLITQTGLRALNGVSVSPLKPLPIGLLRAVKDDAVYRNRIAGEIIGRQIRMSYQEMLEGDGIFDEFGKGRRALYGRGKYAQAVAPAGVYRTPSEVPPLTWVLPDGMPDGVALTVTIRYAADSDAAKWDVPPVWRTTLTSPATTQSIPTSVLLPGKSYGWSLSYGAPGVGASGASGGFSILSRADAARIETAERAVAKAPPGTEERRAAELLLGFVYGSYGIKPDRMP
jgi:hypothetical protein